MFSLAAKIVKKLALYPIPILATSLIVALLCIIPISNLRWDLQLQDTQKRRAISITWLAVAGISVLTHLFNQKELAEILLYILGLCFAVHVHLLGDAQPPRLSSWR